MAQRLHLPVVAGYTGSVSGPGRFPPDAEPVPCTTASEPVL